MGWGSGGGLFDTVADALIDAQADVPFSEELFVRILQPLFDELRANDWDTVDESIDKFRDYPVILSVLRSDGWGAPDPRDAVADGDSPDGTEWGL